MNLIEVTRQFKTDDDCIDYLERLRWPNGVCCIKCGSTDISTIERDNTGKNKRSRIYQCLEKECGHQFSPTAGTVFHDSHLPLTKWFMAMALICEAKKGISAKQVARHLGLEKSYKTAWYLCHRIRKAMKEGGLLGAAGETVEADETYLKPRKPRKGAPYVKKEHKEVVLGMVERGGRLRLVPVSGTKVEDLMPAMEKHISPDVKMIYTDEHPIYDWGLKNKFPGRHQTINHSRTYVAGEVHTNTVENAFSLLKRGLYGTFHQVSIKHLGRYCEEFSYRFNRRYGQSEMFDVTLRGLLREKPLPLKELTGI